MYIFYGLHCFDKLCNLVVHNKALVSILMCYYWPWHGCGQIVVFSRRFCLIISTNLVDLVSYMLIDELFLGNYALGKCGNVLVDGLVVFSQIGKYFTFSDRFKVNEVFVQIFNFHMIFFSLRILLWIFDIYFREFSRFYTQVFSVRWNMNNWLMVWHIDLLLFLVM